MLQSLVVFVVAVAVVLLVLKLIGKSIKILWGVLINSLIGFIVLSVLKAVGLGVEINLLSAILTGLLGIPGLIIVLIIQLVL